MSQYTDTFQLGATNLVVGTGVSNIIQVLPGRCVNGGFFKISGGSGTLAIVQGPGVSFNTGYPVGAAEVVQWQGPAKFWLAASGATMTVSYVPSYNDGFSALP